MNFLSGKEETVLSPCNVKNIGSVFTYELFCKDIIPSKLVEIIPIETIEIIMIFIIFIFSV